MPNLGATRTTWRSTMTASIDAPAIVTVNFICGTFGTDRAWIYAMGNLPPAQIMTSIGVILVFRTFFVTAFFGSIITWVHYQLQWQSVNNLAVYFDSTLMSSNPGLGNYGSMQLSAILAANKTLLGYLIIAGIGLLIFILLHTFGDLKYKIARFKVKFLSKGKKRRDMLITENVESLAGVI